MNDNHAHIELPEFATLNDRLGRAIEAAREAVSLRLGYEVEVAGLEPVEREGHANMRVYWRRSQSSFTSCTEAAVRGDRRIAEPDVVRARKPVRLSRKRRAFGTGEQFSPVRYTRF
jgi:hypothetical protein